jgi:hypothetical protein
MTTRAVVRHARYWRGKIHRWSTVYQFVGTPSSGLTQADAQTILEHDDAMCFQASGLYMTTYECQLYNQAVGGVPLVSYTRATWDDHTTWIAPSGTAWTTTGGYAVDVAEAALLVEWPAGLSKTGKPVNLRKWYHAVPVVGVGPGSPDVQGPDLTSLAAHASTMIGVLGSKGLVLGSQSGRLGGTPRVDAYYVTHQMPRGRRKKATAKNNPALDSYIQGVIDQELGKISAS